MALNERYVPYLADENLNHIMQFADHLFLDATWIENDVGALTIRLPEKYCQQLIDLGLQDKDCMPKFYILVYHVVGNKCCLWEKQIWVIDSPLIVLQSSGACYVQLEANSTNHLLTYRSIFEDADENDDGEAQNPYVNIQGPADQVMHQIFSDQFGDAANLDSGKNAVRDWITNGCVANGVAKDENGNEMPDGQWCGAECDPRLDYRGTLFEIFQECAKASAAQDTPMYFELAPTCTQGPYGEQVSLPLVFNTCCGHSGVDRTVGNTQGNVPIILSENNGSIASYTLGPNFENDYSVAMTAGVDSDGNPIENIICDNDKSTCGKFGWKEAIQIDKDAMESGEVESANQAFLEEGKNKANSVIEFANGPAVCYGDPKCVSGDFSGGDCITIESKGCRYEDVRVNRINLKCQNGKTEYKIGFENI